MPTQLIAFCWQLLLVSFKYSLDEGRADSPYFMGYYSPLNPHYFPLKNMGLCGLKKWLINHLRSGMHIQVEVPSIIIVRHINNPLMFGPLSHHASSKIDAIDIPVKKLNSSHEQTTPL